MVAEGAEGADLMAEGAEGEVWTGEAWMADGLAAEPRGPIGRWWRVGGWKPSAAEEELGLRSPRLLRERSKVKGKARESGQTEIRVGLPRLPC